jgi:dinuclear metal center YbgI/SA1388 family protein
MTELARIAEHLDRLLRTTEIPDYDRALNGVQCAHQGPVGRVACAVDFSLQTVERAIAGGANLLLVHHGMFWGGLQPLTGSSYERIRLLVAHDVAVYAAHLPLDCHPTVGNNVLLARELGLDPSSTFGRYREISVGVAGTAEIPTDTLVARARRFAEAHGGHVVATPVGSGRITRHWAIVTGAGASSDTIAEARAAGIDTLIVGEGPHHTAVQAMEEGIALIYAGHYATETLGVQALGRNLEATFGLPWFFIDAPTGL